MRKSHLLGASLLALVASSPAFAQTAPTSGPAGTTLEEIVVTATKRPQSLQNVPISVAVTSQQTVERAQIRDLIDLQSVVPSLKVSQFNAVGQTDFTIRGFGNGSGNDGIESSVGVFVDGVYRSRAASALDDLPEIDRVEVLRGPQSTLFGKNVSAGAISIVTKKPQFDFGGKAELSVGNYGYVQAKGTVTGPVTDTLALRLSGNIDERGGFYKNETTGTTVDNRNRWSLRADALWQPTSKISARVIADFNQIHEICCAAESIFNGPATQFIGAPAPFGLGALIGNPATLYDRNFAFNTDPSNKLIGRGISAQVDDDLGFAKLTSISAYRNQANRSIQDVDFTGADLANKDQGNHISTFTQELRLASSGNGPLNWLVGGFFQDERLQTGQDITYGTQLRAYADGISGQVPAALLGALPAPLQAALTGHSNIYALELLQSLVTPSIKPGSTYFQTGQGIDDFYNMHQLSYSFFSQADYKITPRLTVTAGLAYMADHKSASSNVTLNDPFSALNLQDVPQFGLIGLPVGLYSALGGLQFYYANTTNHEPVNFPNATESGKLDGDKVTYAARVAYDLGLANVYFSYSTGWKAGAFNLSSDSRPPDANGVGRTARPENVTVYEAGLKARVHNGFLNLAIFDQTISDFQSNEYTGLGYALVNAGKESVRGVELDTAYKPIEWLSLTGAVTYLDPRYDSFDEAPCVSYDTVRCPTNPLTGLTPNFRNLSGTRPAGIPTWTASTSATVTHDFGSGYGTYLRGEFDYTSDYQLIDTTPPNLSTFGRQIVNATLGFTSKKQQLEFMIWARNLTNYNTVIYTFPTVAQTGSYSAFLDDPRTYGVTIRKTF